MPLTCSMGWPSASLLRILDSFKTIKIGLLHFLWSTLIFKCLGNMVSLLTIVWSLCYNELLGIAEDLDDRQGTPLCRLVAPGTNRRLALLRLQALRVSCLSCVRGCCSLILKLKHKG